MKQMQAGARTRGQAIETHQHHWLIDAADGPLSDGRCKRCGATRSFSNRPTITTWIHSDGRAHELSQVKRDRGRERGEVRLSDEAA